MKDSAPYFPADTGCLRPPILKLINAATMTPQPVTWLWPGFLAKGKIHILAGAPGTGKTTIAMHFGAAVSSGGSWPDGSVSPSGNVVIWSGEDDPDDTLLPRLLAAGATLERCHFVGDVFEDQKPRAFDPARDIECLRTAISDAGGAALLIIDSIVSAIATDSHKNSDVRRGLKPLVDLASETGCAVLGITHFSKGTSDRDPVERLTGSIAFGALARVVMIAGQRRAEDDDGLPRGLLMRAKSNIGPDGGGFDYDLEQVSVANYPSIVASVVAFRGAVAGDARTAFAGLDPRTADEGGELLRAKDFLAGRLSEGPCPTKEVKTAATSQGISERTLERAKESLRIKARKGKEGGPWTWEMPDYGRNTSCSPPMSPEHGMPASHGGGGVGVLGGLDDTSRSSVEVEI